MLRSRSNRQQRPSESTDEQQGRSRSSGSLSSHNYGGYPSHSGAPSPMTVGIASGADDNDYGQSSPRGRGGRWGGGGVGGKKTFGGGGGKKVSFGNRKAWDGHQGLGGTTGPAKGNHKRGNSSIGSSLIILFSVAFVVTAAMGGAVFHFRRTTARIEHMIAVTKRKTTPGQRHANNLDRFKRGGDAAEEAVELKGDGVSIDTEVVEEDPAMRVNPQELSELRSERSELQAKSRNLSASVASADRNVVSLQAQIKHLSSNENPGYQTRITAMKERLKEEETRSDEFKEQFVEKKKKIENKNMDSIEEYEEFVKKREDALWGKIDVLKEKIGRESRREAEEWFGAGPHKVELEIEYPRYTENVEPSEWPRVRGVLTIEMAPLSLMPVAVNLFLQQVHHKLWTGCSFVINAMHILQAGPHRVAEGVHDANDAALVRKFVSARLDKMPFQEYSGEYPHGRHTIGFAGRPGGPDFYVNKIDNSANHGPGGQSQHDLHEEADSCFGKLAEDDGRNMGILGELDRIPADLGLGSLLLSPVLIVDSRVIVEGLVLESPEPVQEMERQRAQQLKETKENGNGDGGDAARSEGQSGDRQQAQQPEETKENVNGDGGDAAQNEGQSDENNPTNDIQGGDSSNRVPVTGPGQL